jgi:hypothetical protein
VGVLEHSGEFNQAGQEREGALVSRVGAGERVPLVEEDPGVFKSFEHQSDVLVKEDPLDSFFVDRPVELSNNLRFI